MEARQGEARRGEAKQGDARRGKARRGEASRFGRSPWSKELQGSLILWPAGAPTSKTFSMTFDIQCFIQVIHPYWFDTPGHHKRCGGFHVLRTDRRTLGTSRNLGTDDEGPASMQPKGSKFLRPEEWTLSRLHSRCLTRRGDGELRKSYDFQGSDLPESTQSRSRRRSGNELESEMSKS